MVSKEKPPPCYFCELPTYSRIHDAVRYILSLIPYRCYQCGFRFIHPRILHEEE